MEDGARGAAAQPVGHVVQASGSRASLRLSRRPDGAEQVTVGKFVGVPGAGSTVVGLVTGVAGGRGGPDPETTCTFDILGELRARRDGGRPVYVRGVSDYPALGVPAFLLGPDELADVFDSPGHLSIGIGRIHQDSKIEARVRVDDMLAKHFAVLGSTGVGKSSGVAVIVGEVLRARPDLRIFFIDPHNEYGSCFGDRAESLTPRNLRLPFWLFNFEEFVDVLFRGRPGNDEETGILAETIPLAKAMLAGARGAGDGSALRRPDARTCPCGVDTPVPYRLADLVTLIEERRGKLDNRAVVGAHTRLLARIEAVKNDTRYAFMFDAANVGGDTMAEVITRLFRIPADDRPMTVMQLAGFPSEVIDSVVSVVCRMAFEFGVWSDGASPMLVVCEEAHRYAPADRSLGFGPTRKAVSRIAKEGRKYGVHLGLVTQRPGELDATIVSQCSTIFVMRMANERDQAIVRAAVSDAAASLLDFVPALAGQEVFAFGEGVPLPTRLRFNDLPRDRIPRSEAVHRSRLRSGQIDAAFVAAVVERWRGATSGRPKGEDGLAPPTPTLPLRGGMLPQAGDPGYVPTRPAGPYGSGYAGTGASGSGPAGSGPTGSGPGALQDTLGRSFGIRQTR